MRKKNLITLCILSLIINNTKVLGQDMLTEIKDNSQLIIDLKDYFKAYHVNHTISDQYEYVNRFVSEDIEDSELASLTEKNIQACKELKKLSFKNDSLDYYVNKHLDLSIEIYQIAKNEGFDSQIFADAFELYVTDNSKYFNYLYSPWYSFNLEELSEESFWEINNKTNYINSPDYKTYENLKDSNVVESINILEDILEETINFQEQSIYQIELADQYVTNAFDFIDKDSGNVLGYDIAISIYNNVINKKKYSLYLFEAWLKWRTVTQHHSNGLSTWSYIPNDEYNKMRLPVALTILKYIQENKDDIMAINQFVLIAEHDIVRRFGDYQYGNQNTIEYHQIFGWPEFE